MASILARLALDNSDFAAGMRRALALASTFGTKINSVLKPEKFGSQLAGYFTIGAIGLAAKATIDYGSSVNDLSKELGLTTKTIQSLDYALKLNGTSLEENRQLFSKLTDSIDKANKGDAALISSFSRLGIKVDDLKSKNIDEIFLSIADAVKKGELTPRMFADLIDTMGSSASKVIPAMKEGVSDLANEFVRLGLVIDDPTIKRLDELGDRFDQLKIQGTAAMAEIVVGTNDAALAFGRAYQKAVDFFRSATMSDYSPLFGNQWYSLPTIFGNASVGGGKPKEPDPRASTARAETMAAERAADLQAQAADLQEKNEKALADLVFERLSTEEKILRITAFRVSLMERLKSIEDPLQRQQLIAAELAASKELGGLNQKKPGAGSTIRPDLNSLQQVGAFTAQRAINIRPEQIAQKQLDTLGKIEQNTRQTKAKTVTFP